MPSEKLYVLPGLDESRENGSIAHRRRSGGRQVDPSKREVNPAMAFTYSILFWGGGQLHNNQDWMGFALAFLMFLFYGCLGAAIVRWDLLLEYMGLFPGSLSTIYMGAVLFATLGVTLWLSSSVQAYLRASWDRYTLFNGVNNHLFPFICSLILPGWGQFLNGQTRKGTLFVMASLAGYVSVSVIVLTMIFWPYLDTAAERIAVEWLLTPAILILPAFLLASLVSGYDALRVSLDEIKKEPWKKRLEYANNRRRMKGWRRGVWPQIRLTMGLSLVLCLCLGVAYHLIPQDFYTLSLRTARDVLVEHHLTVIPELLNRALLLLSA